MNNVKDLAHLCALEDDYFDHLSILVALRLSYLITAYNSHVRVAWIWMGRKSDPNESSIGEHAYLLVNTCKLDNRVKQPLLVAYFI